MFFRHSRNLLKLWSKASRLNPPTRFRLSLSRSRFLSLLMALKAVHVSDVPHLDQVPENASLALYSNRFSKGNFVALRRIFAFSGLIVGWILIFIGMGFRLGLAGVELGRNAFRASKFLVIGHRGSGMNALQSSDRRMRAIKENSILSFNAAAKFPIDFVEFDVQVGFRSLDSCFLFRVAMNLYGNALAASLRSCRMRRASAGWGPGFVFYLFRTLWDIHRSSLIFDLGF